VDIIVRLLATGLLVWFGLLIALITVRILRRDINVSGFLTPTPGSEVAPERVLAMAAVPTVLVMFVLEALRVDLATHPSLPNIPDILVTVLTGSNSLYLAGKIARSSGGAS